MVRSQRHNEETAVESVDKWVKEFHDIRDCVIAGGGCRGAAWFEGDNRGQNWTAAIVTATTATLVSHPPPKPEINRWPRPCLCYDEPFGSIPAHTHGQSLWPWFWAAANQITRMGHNYASKHISMAMTFKTLGKDFGHRLCAKVWPETLAMKKKVWPETLPIALQILVKQICEKKNRKCSETIEFSLIRRFMCISRPRWRIMTDRLATETVVALLPRTWICRSFAKVSGQSFLKMNFLCLLSCVGYLKDDLTGASCTSNLNLGQALSRKNNITLHVGETSPFSFSSVWSVSRSVVMFVIDLWVTITISILTMISFAIHCAKQVSNSLLSIFIYILFLINSELD